MHRFCSACVEGPRSAAELLPAAGGGGGGGGGGRRPRFRGAAACSAAAPATAAQINSFKKHALQVKSTLRYPRRQNSSCETRGKMFSCFAFRGDSCWCEMQCLRRTVCSSPEVVPAAGLAGSFLRTAVTYVSLTTSLIRSSKNQQQLSPLFFFQIQTQ